LNQAVHREDFVSASRYMQVTAAQRPNAERLARDLTDLIDQYYIEPIAALSDAPEGTTDDGLPLDREHVFLTIDGEPVDIELVRVKNPQAGLVRLISSRTLSRVPSLRRSGGVTWLARVMPESLVNATLFGVSFARWWRGRRQSRPRWPRCGCCRRSTRNHQRMRTSRVARPKPGTRARAAAPRPGKQERESSAEAAAGHA
jgi:hypothetical protein